MTTPTRLQALLGVKATPIGLTFHPTPPPGVPHVAAAAPSGCSYWKRAAEGQTFYTEARRPLQLPDRRLHARRRPAAGADAGIARRRRHDGRRSATSGRGSAGHSAADGAVRRGGLRAAEQAGGDAGRGAGARQRQAGDAAGGSRQAAGVGGDARSWAGPPAPPSRSPCTPSAASPASAASATASTPRWRRRILLRPARQARRRRGRETGGDRQRQPRAGEVPSRAPANVAA